MNRKSILPQPALPAVSKSGRGVVPVVKMLLVVEVPPLLVDEPALEDEDELAEVVVVVEGPVVSSPSPLECTTVVIPEVTGVLSGASGAQLSESAAIV